MRLTSFILVILLLGTPVDVKHPASLSVSPHFTIPSKPITATINILEDDRNREACLSWEGEFESGSHCWDHLDYTDFPSHIEYPVKLHTLGPFQFQLSLRRTDKIFRTPNQEVEVH